jgi:arsenate reductase-like glutaredoxin family protein
MTGQSVPVTIYHNPACGTSRNTLAHPILINRPIVVTRWGVRLCRPSEVVLVSCHFLKRVP